MTRARRQPTSRLLRPFLARHWGALAGAAVSTVALSAATLAAPWPLKLAIDHLIGDRRGRFTLSGADAALLAGLGGLVLAIATVDAAATYLSDFWLNRSGERIVHDCGWRPTRTSSGCRWPSTPAGPRAIW
jgi:ABC-type multidrug transport system fused ATPase/permease subunit